ncbi:hypothetical protein BDK51DRAFT_35166 [Blyttiomyces helicus]|uniref:Uncharacterized protein n=1 Tax=Blyttiomyces helicus TaxID=388810 RepID=A0A4P9WSV8_9FUNG|nr:hypothetical protein BDK51DRAFT_35166 [Blyttiomyces helicus]|eukprot:RKO94400.1 hypothetical protein BDK51DRAFT_35166 [Blyttiomyces helicus]
MLAIVSITFPKTSHSAYLGAAKRQTPNAQTLEEPLIHPLPFYIPLATLATHAPLPLVFTRYPLPCSPLQRAAVQMVQAPSQALLTQAQTWTLPGDGGAGTLAVMAWAARSAARARTAAMTGTTLTRTASSAMTTSMRMKPGDGQCAAEDHHESAGAILLQDVGAQEASGNHFAWGGRPADVDDTDKDKEMWENESADKNETGDADPTADHDGIQDERSAACASHCDEVAFSGLWACHPDEHAADSRCPEFDSTLLHPRVATSKLLRCKASQMRAMRILVKVVSAKLTALLFSALMISLLDVASFWEHQLEHSKCINDAAEATNHQQRSICPLQQRGRWVISVSVAGMQMGSDGRFADGITMGFLHYFLFSGVFLHYTRRKASPTAVTASSAEFPYLMRSKRTRHMLMRFSILDNPPLDQLGLHTLTPIPEGDLALLAKGL